MRLAAIRSLLAERNYAIFMSCNAFSLIGTWVHRIAIAWLAWELTKSPFWIGVIAAAGFVPIFIVGPIGGVMADRFNQKRQIIASQFLAFLLMLALFVVYELGALNLWLLILFRILLTTLVSIAQPARLVLVPKLVSPQNLTAAVSFGALVFNLARLIGPGVAGILLVGGDFGLAFLLNGFSYLALCAGLFAIKVDTSAPPSRKRKRSVFADIGESFSYIRRHEGIAAMFLLYAVCVIAGRPVSEMIPAFVDGVFDAGLGGVAFVTSAMALGSILGGLWSVRGNADGLTMITVAASAAYGLCIAIFAWMPHFYIAVAVLTIASAFSVIHGVSAQTLVQTAVEEGMRGRVLSLWFVLSRGGPALGAFAIGALSEVAGIVALFTLGGALCVLAAGRAWAARTTLLSALEGLVLERSRRGAAES